MAQASLGFVETRGFVALVKAIDAMLKAADVRFVKWEKVGMGYLAAVIEGDVGAVRAAVEAGVAAAKEIDEARAAIIANPLPEFTSLLLQGASA